MQAIWQNDEIGDPVYQGLMLGGIHTGTPLLKANYPGLRAIRVGNIITFAKDLPDSYTVPTTTVTDDARGVLGYAERTTPQTGVTTLTDLTGLSVAVTVAASRRIRVTGQARMAIDAAITNRHVPRGYIREGTTTLGWFGDWNAEGVSFGGARNELRTGAVILTPSAGAHTYKLSLERAAGTVATVGIQAGTDNPAFILVEDIGPVTPGGTSTTIAELWY